MANSEPARDQCAAAAGDAEAACLAACGPGLSASVRIAIVTTRPVIVDWLEDGYDLVADILPTLAERTRHQRDDPIRTWAYFTKAIAKRHALRLALAARTKSAGETGMVATVSAPLSPQDVLQRMADWLNSGRFVPPSAVNNTTRDALLRAGLVTEATLRSYQIY